MRTINLTIEKQTLTLDSLESLPVQGSDNSVKLAFAFDNSWESYPTRRAYFQYHFSNWKYVELSNNEVLVPREFLAKPGFKVMIRGYAQSGAIMATNIENVPVEFAPSLADSTAVVPVAIRSGDDAIAVEQEGDVVTISLNDEFESNKFISDYTIRGTAQGEIIFLDGVLLGTTEKSFADFKSVYSQIVIPYEFTIGATTYHDTLVATETRYNAQNAYYVADLLPLGQNYTAIVTIYLDETSVKAVVACLPFTLNNSFDNAPTQGSTKLVNSGAVYSALENVKTLLRAYSDANLATAKSYADDLLVESKQYTDTKYNSLVGIITHETEVMEARIAQAITQMQNQVNASITGMETTIQGELTALDQRVDEAISTMNTTISSSLTNMETTIQQELANLDTRFSTLQTALEARITTLSNQIDSQFSTLQTQLEGRIDTLEGEVDDKLSEADEAIAILNGYNERLTKVEGTYVTKLELYEALKRGEISSEVEKVYTSEINYITDNLMPSGKVTKILGKTEKSENLIVYENIINANDHDVTFSINNGIVRMKGTWTGTASGYIPAIMKRITLNTGTYTLSGFNLTGLDSSQSVRLRVAKEDFTTIQEVVLDSPNKSFSFTLSETQDVRVLVRMGAFSSTNDFIFAPMLVQGTTAPTEWKQGYEGLKHTHITGLKSTGINLWDEVTEQGSIDSNGNNVDSTTSFRSKNFIPIKPNGNYMLHYGSYSSNSVIYYYFYDSNKNFISSNLTLSENQAFTAPALACYMKIRSGGSNPQNTYNHDICINFSNPNINGNYYPYEEDTLEIEADLNEWDSIDVEEKKRYEGSLEVTFNGSEDWFFGSVEDSSFESGYFYYAQYSGLPNTILKPITHANPSDIIWSGKVDSINSGRVANSMYISTAGTFQLNAPNNNAITTKADFLTWLSNNPLTIVIPLSTPIVTDVEIPKDGWIDNLIQGGSITQQVDTTDTTALIAKEVDIAVNVVVDNQ